ncbi:hypothetical protein DF3PA_190011 [Candidatus Defluviicoccus seviourii]|uniref:Uncharacterized protein n=2 Tax=root TaxID=1 RepID=A0A564WC48_9PROT|nr:hypothetical protein DF3PB_840008 [uncultured Defluviicoccus sp.]VUX46045.1 hypothetical protein DF3PA_190011 [Candidatus Defluviicoccus seviourii]
MNEPVEGLSLRRHNLMRKRHFRGLVALPNGRWRSHPAAAAFSRLSRLAAAVDKDAAEPGMTAGMNPVAAPGIALSPYPNALIRRRLGITSARLAAGARNCQR